MYMGNMILPRRAPFCLVVSPARCVPAADSPIITASTVGTYLAASQDKWIVVRMFPVVKE